MKTSQMKNFLAFTPQEAAYILNKSNSKESSSVSSGVKHFRLEQKYPSPNNPKPFKGKLIGR